MSSSLPVLDSSPAYDVVESLRFWGEECLLVAGAHGRHRRARPLAL